MLLRKQIKQILLNKISPTLNISTLPEILTLLFHTLEAKYLSKFRPNLLVFTQLLAQLLCDLNMQLIFLVRKISYIILFERFPLTSNNSITLDWMFLGWILNNLFLLSKSLKELIFSLWTIRNNHSSVLWNIQIKGQ